MFEQTTQYSISEEEYNNILKGKDIGFVPKKTIPPPTATREPIGWEKSVPWQVNLGRNITGIFEHEVGPSRRASALGAGGLVLLRDSWVRDLKMLAPFLFGTSTH